METTNYYVGLVATGLTKGKRDGEAKKLGRCLFQQPLQAPKFQCSHLYECLKQGLCKAYVRESSPSFTSLVVLQTSIFKVSDFFGGCLVFQTRD